MSHSYKYSKDQGYFNTPDLPIKGGFMILTGSVITCIKGSLLEVVDFLKSFEQIDVHTFDEEKSVVVVTIEEESDSTLDELCKKLQEHPSIIQVSHHYFNFEDEIDKINKGLPVDFTLKGFSKSEQRRERSKLSEY